MFVQFSDVRCNIVFAEFLVASCSIAFPQALVVLYVVVSCLFRS